MEEKKDIKNTIEAMDGVMLIAVFLIKRLKDGIGIDDAMALAAKLGDDDEFKKVLSDAYTGIDQIDDEIGDLSWEEGFELIQAISNHVPAIVEAFKK